MDTEYLEILLGKREPSLEILETRDLYADFLRFFESEKLPYYKDEQLIEECKQEIKDMTELAKKRGVKIGKCWLNEDYINNLAKGMAQEHIKERMWDNYYCGTLMAESIVDNHPNLSKFEGSEREELVLLLRNMLFSLAAHAYYQSSPEYRRGVENFLQKYRNQ